MTQQGIKNSLLTAEQHIVLSQTYFQFAQLAAELTELFTKGGEKSIHQYGGGFTIDRMSQKLAEIARSVVDADVAYVRTIDHPTVNRLVLGSVSTRDGSPPEGKIAEYKYRDDCDFDDETVHGGDRTDAQNALVFRRNADGSLAPEGGRGDKYSKEEIEHFRGIGSEAFVPLYLLNGRRNDGKLSGGVAKAFIVLCHRSTGHFSSQRLELLKALRGFFDQFYRLADLHQDRENKGDLLRDIVAVLPLIADASEAGVQRAICTLLTCEPGFGFNRAVLFWMSPEGRLPARCAMAVGGLNSSWRDEQESIKNSFGGSLFKYIVASVMDPVPKMKMTGELDPLHQRLCIDAPANYATDDEALPGLLQQLLKNPGSVRDRALRLSIESTEDSPTHDEWLKRLLEKNPDILRCPQDEYFLFPLLPFPSGEEQDPPLVGFVLCDMAYRPHAHSPGFGFPDLELAALVVRLVASLWAFRRKADSAFGILGALPALTHTAPKLAGMFSGFVDGIEKQGINLRDPENPMWSELKGLEMTFDELHSAARLIAETRDVRNSRIVPIVQNAVQQFCMAALPRYRNLQSASVVDCSYSGGVRIPTDWLNEVLDILFQNINDHGVDLALPEERQAGSIAVRIRIREQKVQESSGDGNRVIIEVEDNGKGVPPAIAPYIMLPRVSTRTEKGHGTGLSLAQLQLKSVGGGVILDSPSGPTRFCLVLDKASV